MKKTRKNLDFLKGLYIAHRGLHNKNAGIPENSMSAFKAALDAGVAAELDLHLLKDGKIAVFHDDNLHRMTGVDKNIKDCVYDEIKDLQLLGASSSDEKIPLLQDVLDLVDGKIILDIELKNDLPTGMLESAVSACLDNYKGGFIVKSFSPFTVKWFRKHRPQYIRGQLSCSFESNKDLSRIEKFICRNMFLNFLAKPDFIAYELQSLPKKRVEKYRKKNYPLLVWTIRSDEELSNAKKYGDSFIYENIKIVH